jgi:AcrR family transcriptional regulator
MGRRKLVEDDELLAVAREVFVEQGIAASTRDIARRAGISQAVIYQRHPTKAHLFFAAMVPPALNVEDLLTAPAHDLSVVEQLEGIALGMMRYFREVVPILLQLVTHPEFDVEEFAQRHPDSPFGRMHVGLIQYLESQRARGRIVAEHVEPAALTLFAALHSLAVLERLGVHGGTFDDDVIRAMVRALWTGLAPISERNSRGGITRS